MQKSNSESSKLTLYLLGLLIFIYPFGPALQNVGMGIVFLSNLYFLLKNSRLESLGIPARAIWLLASLLALLLWNVCATYLNSENHEQEKFAYIMGYAPLLLLPWLAASLPKLKAVEEGKLLSFAAIVVLLWGLIATSQNIWPWTWVRTALELGGIRRAQGFYSHPLSLAYAALLIWPFILRQLLSSPKAWQSWFLSLGNLLLLVYSMSRIVQLLVAISTLWNIFQLFSGRRRWQMLILITVMGSAIALTDNPVSIRFKHLMNAERIDHQSSYPDDRLAFWHSHLLMIQDRPLLGHGIHLDLDFRKPYYEKLGLGDFKKQYQAHNQYLQIMTEGGLIAFVLFSAWFYFGFKLIRHSGLPPFLIGSAQQCLWIFLLGGLTQNAFYDTTVRTGLVIFWLLIFVRMPAHNTRASETEITEGFLPRSLHS